MLIGTQGASERGGTALGAQNGGFGNLPPPRLGRLEGPGLYLECKNVFSRLLFQLSERRENIPRGGGNGTARGPRLRAAVAVEKGAPRAPGGSEQVLPWQPGRSSWPFPAAPALLEDRSRFFRGDLGAQAGPSPRPSSSWRIGAGSSEATWALKLALPGGPRAPGGSKQVLPWQPGRSSGPFPAAPELLEDRSRFFRGDLGAQAGPSPRPPRQPGRSSWPFPAPPAAAWATWALKRALPRAPPRSWRIEAGSSVAAWALELALPRGPRGCLGNLGARAGPSPRPSTLNPNP
jgi:hypothetical protein